MIETTTTKYHLALLSEDEELALKQVCMKYGTRMTHHFELDYYSIFFSQEQWLLAVLELPTITNTLTKQVIIKEI